MELLFEQNDMARNRVTLVFLMVLTGVAVYLCYLLVAPFLKPIAFAAILAIILYPLHARIHKWVRSPNIAALFSTTLAVLAIASLTFFLGRAVLTGLRDIYQSLSGSGDVRERLGLFIVRAVDWAITVASNHIPISVPDLQKAVSNQSEKAVAELLTMVAGAAGNLSTLFLNALLSFIVLFFLLRDGKAMLRRGSIVLPLSRNQVTRLFQHVKDLLYAIVYGTLAIAAVQGTLAGVAFWILGLTSPVVWGLVTALCAMLPIIGTTLVFFPAICMLAVGGHWVKALILVIWAVVIVHPVDNLLRPYLIGERVRLSTLYVLVALLGGLKAFGGLGVFLGPLILAVTIALFGFLREEKRAGNWNFQ